MSSTLSAGTLLSVPLAPLLGSALAGILALSLVETGLGADLHTP